LKEQFKEVKSKRALIGDIGGTKSRLALFYLKENSLNNLKIYYTKNFPSLSELLKTYLEEEGVRASDKDFPDYLFLALAGPVIKDRAFLTNVGWKVSVRTLQRHFPFKKIKLVNDLYALAASLFHLKEEDFFIVKEGKKIRSYPKIFLAPGTGLGVSILYSLKPLEILPSEGGHTPFSPQSEEEFLFADFLRRYGKPPTYEEALSGKGLMNWYAFYTGKEISPQEIIDLYKKGDTFAERVILKFFEVLGRKCYELSVLVQPYGGIYLAGGVLEGLKDFFEIETFKKAFMENLYFSERLKELIEHIPIFLNLHPFPVLLGVQTILRNLLR